MTETQGSDEWGADGWQPSAQEPTIVQGESSPDPVAGQAPSVAAEPAVPEPESDATEPAPPEPTIGAEWGDFETPAAVADVPDVPGDAEEPVAWSAEPDEDFSADVAEPLDEEAAESIEAPAGEVEAPEVSIAMPAPPFTGEQRVDDAVAPLHDLGDLPTEEHVAGYEATHNGLQDVLADLDRDPDGS